jgi:hypothetical protein
MAKTYKCQYCKFNVTENKIKGVKSAKYKMGLHYDTIHKNLLPIDMSGFRYFYFLLTKKEKGSCVICKQDTVFNNVSMKYSRFCNNPLCKEKYKEERNNRMMKKYGKICLLNDPEQQKKMQAGRRIAGIYNWSDNKSKFGYLSSYEKDFLEYLDIKLHWPSSDLISPSPHTYSYDYDGKSHYYMPDFFIPSLNLEIEIKDDGSAKNINPDSRAKDIIKDDLMKSLSNLFNYIKIVNKNYSEFEELLKEEDN